MEVNENKIVMTGNRIRRFHEILASKSSDNINYTYIDTVINTCRSLLEELYRVNGILGIVNNEEIMQTTVSGEVFKLLNQGKESIQDSITEIDVNTHYLLGIYTNFTDALNDGKKSFKYGDLYIRNSDYVYALTQTCNTTKMVKLRVTTDINSL
tara:strand:- start:224 stop:685 length:462 start_codon:yes stop_codon:yes gene_type:complete